MRPPSDLKLTRTNITPLTIQEKFPFSLGGMRFRYYVGYNVYPMKVFFGYILSVRCLSKNQSFFSLDFVNLMTANNRKGNRHGNNKLWYLEEPGKKGFY